MQYSRTTSVVLPVNIASIMGRHQQPKTLQGACLHNIAKNMESRWCADYYKNFYGQGTYLQVLGPFDCLTPDLIQQLIQCLAVNGWMKRYYLHVLLDWRFERLDLKVCKKAANKDSIINLVMVRCQKLTSLNIGGCNQVSARMLSDLVMALPNLTELSLRHTKCGDQVLTQIGLCCKNIRQLDVYGCPVTDMGIMSMCVSFDPKQSKVEKLYKLDISFTAVTHKAVEIILCHCKNIQILHYPDICAAIYHMDLKGVFDGTEYKEPLRLQILSLMMMKDMDCHPDDSLRISCIYCPYITEVYIHRGVTDRGVLQLKTLTYLKALHLTNDSGEEITFEGGLLPLLRSTGSHLEELIVSEVNYLDLGLIGVCCPVLRKLSCLTAGCEVASFPVHTHPEITLQKDRVTPFQHLEDLRLSIYNEHNDFPSYILSLILLNAKQLRELHLVQIQTFTDSLICDILKTNPLCSLQRLSLEQCNNISLDPIYDICTTDNDLTYLSLRNCSEITRTDYEQLISTIQEDNLDLVLEWC